MLLPFNPTLVATEPSILKGTEIVTLAIGGDLLLSSRNAHKQRIQSKCEMESLNLGKNPNNWPWGNITDLLLSCDYRLFNLETPVSNAAYKPTVLPSSKTKKKGFQVSEVVKTILLQAGTSMLSLANNHMLDIPTGVRDTKKFLDEIGICSAGAGQNLKEAMRPCVFEASNIRVAAFAAADLRSIRGGDETREFAQQNSASDVKSGIWDLHNSHLDSLVLNFNASFFSSIADSIRDATTYADIILFCIHWQKNDAGFRPEPSFVEFAHRLIDAGVDIVVGSHPHHIQPIEIYKSKLIIYGSGESLRAYPNPSFAHRNHEIGVLYRIAVHCKHRRSATKQCRLRLVRLTPLLVNHKSCSVAVHTDSQKAKDFVCKVNHFNRCIFAEDGDDLVLHLGIREDC